LKSTIKKFHNDGFFMQDNCKCLLFLCRNCAKREHSRTYDPYLRECQENQKYFNDDMNICNYCYM